MLAVLPNRLKATIVAFLSAIPWIVWDAVRFTNRLVGPLARFRETMRHVTADKPVRRIRLRQGDFLMEMQDDFNALLSALKHRGAVNLEPADEAAPVPPQHADTRETGGVRELYARSPTRS